MDIEAAIKDAFSKSYGAMSQKGFGISGEVRIAVDPNLPIMGYTFTKDGVHFIVVSGGAVNSGLLDGLLVHEMSHIYRGETIHPSHDDALVEGVLKKFRADDYKKRVIHEIVNHVKNIYADDVAFEVFKGWDGVFSGEAVRQFFLNWIKTEPLVLKDPKQYKWVNGSILVSNAFALGTAKRHGFLKGFEEEFTARTNVFLNSVDASLVENFEYFTDFFAGLEADMDKALFKKRLTQYLRRFTRMVGDGK